MTPEVRGRIASIRQRLALPETTDDEKIALVKEAVTLVREARGKVMAGVEANRPAKRTAKKSGDELLDSILNGEPNDAA
jgi:hypothetical protein